METPAEAKKKLRGRLLESREAIPEGDYRRKSEAILERLRKLEPFRSASTIHCYISMNDRREPDTHPLLQGLLKEGRKVAVPVTRMEDNTLNHIRLTAWEDLVISRWGVPEPPRGKKVAPEELDLVVVPMVGGDRDRNRLGYGKGYYDRFLQKAECETVGLLFDELLVDLLPVEEFDVPLSRIVTDRQVIGPS